MRGVEGRRDAETVALLAEWLQRPLRDFYSDARGKYRECGDNRSCTVISVADRVRTDFLWQRSPFQLYGGGSGRVESAGIDFILPYWMARYYGVESGVTVVSAASPSAGIAPGSIASMYGTGFGGAARVEVRDAAGGNHTAHLFHVSDTQINLEIPPAAAAGQAVFTVVRSDGTRSSAPALLQPVAPALFSSDMTGKGPASGYAVRIENGGAQRVLPISSCAAPLSCNTVEVDLDDRPVYLVLFGTGFRHSSLADVRVYIEGRPANVHYAGPQSQYAGLDQLNVQLTREHRRAGETDVILTVSGIASNAVRIRLD